MINTIATILGTSVVVGGAVGTILTGFIKLIKLHHKIIKK